MDGKRRGRATARLAVVTLVGLLAGAAAAGPPEVVTSQRRNPIEATRDALAAAQHSFAAAVYKFNEPSLLRALSRALDRGVSVRLLSDAGESSDPRSLVHAAAKAGALVRILPPKQGKMHAKFALVDRREVLAGSFNWTQSAAQRNLEVLIRFDERETVARFEAIFEGLWSGARKLAK